jgi:MFS family permease
VSVVAVFTVSLTLLVSQSDETRRGKDDAYITYQYAKNLAHGEGFVFNVGDPRTLGTSTPLYAGLLALGTRLGISIPLLSIGIGILATSVALSLAVCIAWELGLLSAGLIVALTASVAQLYWRWEGMETPLYLALILGSIWTAFRGWSSLGFLLAALATITRLDGLAVLVAVGLFLALGGRWSWRTIGPGAALLASWLIAATLLFGSPLPASGLAKMAHDTRISGRFDVLSLDLLHQVLPVTQMIPPSAFANHPRRTAALFCLVLSVPLACTVVLRPRRLSAVLASWLVFYLAGYELLRLPNFHWYYGPPAIVLALFLWMALQAALGFAANAIRSQGQLVAVAATWTVAIITLLFVALGTPLYATSHPRRESAHVLAARWLREHAAPGDSVVAYEVGTIAYLSGLRTIDLLGLTNPEARIHLREGDFAWAIRDLPTYVFSNERSAWPVTRAIFNECAFALNYRPATRLPFRVNADYLIYYRAPPEEAQPPGGPWAAEWVDAYHPTSTPRALTTAYSLTLRNLSTSPWRGHTPEAPLVTYEWRDEHGRQVATDALHTPLPCDVGPGQRVLVSASVRAPEEPGTYTLSWHLIREWSGYLSERGMASTSAPVIVR